MVYEWGKTIEEPRFGWYKFYKFIKWHNTTSLLELGGLVLSRDLIEVKRKCCELIDMTLTLKPFSKDL